MVTISDSLAQYTRGVGANLPPIERPVHLLIAEALFRAANTVDPGKKGSLRKATTAQKIILDRSVGTRLPGSNPAASGNVSVSFIDLTVAEIGEGDEPESRKGP